MKNSTRQRITIIACIFVLVSLFKIFHVDYYFSLSYVKESYDTFTTVYASHRITAILLYMTIYILIAGLSLPGATVLTITAGALFGFITGTIIVSFASTIGATLACLLSRFILRDWTQNTFGDKLDAINRGIRNEGPFYLFTLRLIPVFPFFAINMAMGLTRMPVFTFYWVSQTGMLAGTIVYVNAGKELSKIGSISDILSPGLLISFVILGLFPITTKKILELYRKKNTDILQSGS